MTDNGDGTYATQISSSTVAGQATITATDSTPATPVSGSATLTQSALPANSIELTLNPSSIPADGSSKTTARAVVRDRFGNAVPGADVKITSSGGQRVGPVAEAPQGTYEAPVTASTTAGTSEITATVAGSNPSLSATASLVQTQAAPVVVKPKLRFVKPPKKKVRAAKVKFRFKVVQGKAKGFQCRVDRRKWSKCKSPRKVKLKPGRHLFRVRGIATDGTFGKPIKRKIRRVR